ncbi:urease accessory protein [Zalerion maritima]|uniref:Urease accessory protein n=1 Tax=Zalerion maritima TaxID=339359 RepID=A0AAD5WWI0_9PEZI|nr:urease accessory protein [Zalerion maritima]
MATISQPGPMDITNPAASPRENGDIESEIADLEARLAAARVKLRSQPPARLPSSHPHSQSSPKVFSYTPTPHPSHTLLLLSDSALPLGSFAFSSGLESFLHHTPRGSKSPFDTFLPLSISAHAGSTLPFVLAAYRKPTLLPELDDAFDATMMCTVGRRASVAQGRALLGVWEKAFVYSRGAGGGGGGGGGGEGKVQVNDSQDDDDDDEEEEALAVLKSYALSVKRASSHRNAQDATTTTTTTTTASPSSSLARASAHLPPLFGTVSRLLGLSAEQTAYTYLLGHVKALVSAAVRASVFGPYHAQKILASAELVGMLNAAIQTEWATHWEDAGQYVPMIDLWTGRHEMLYSRIFNS